MLRLVMLALLAAAASASYELSGKVEGIVPCDSQGVHPTEVRITDCTTVPCSIVPGKTYDIEVDFTASAEHSALRTTISLIRDGRKTVIIEDILQAHISPGRTYTIVYPWTPLDLDGYTALRIKVVGADPPYIVELCAIVSVR